MYTNPFSSVAYGPCHQPSCSHPYLSYPTGISPWWVKHCTAYDPGCSNNDFKEWPKSQGSKLPFVVQCRLRQMQFLLPSPKHFCCSCWRSRPSNGGPPAIFQTVTKVPREKSPLCRTKTFPVLYIFSNYLLLPTVSLLSQLALCC